ncbi:hypothetical protein [Actinomadura sp. NPDC049753]|uniref:hypothetical protein n=1 Tax=Actinomadura sp. NPDC049753 TaxID=3154739 RepID=UPI00343CAA39
MPATLPALGQRFRRWSADATWGRLLAHFQVHDDAMGVAGLTADRLETVIGHLIDG